MEQKNNQTIDDMAAQWAARSLSGELSATEAAELETWLAINSAHRAAFDSFIETAEAASDAGDAAAAEALERDLYEFARTDASRKRWIIATPAIAASIAAFAYFTVSLFTTSVTPTRFVTQKGERTDIALADGSIVSLNTDSELTFTQSGGERHAVLVSGEAMFDVTRDVERPFVVTTPSAEVRVLGTRFNVRNLSGAAVVSVLSGVVQVGASDLRPRQSDARETTLIAGQQAVVTNDAAAPQVTEFNPDTVVSWRSGKAFYENEMLANVVEDLNRYFAAKIELADPALNDIRVTGGFDLNDQAVAIEALTVALSLRAETQSPTLILLYRDG